MKEKCPKCGAKRKATIPYGNTSVCENNHIWFPSMEKECNEALNAAFPGRRKKMKEKHYCLANNMAYLHLILDLLRKLAVDEEFGITREEFSDIGPRVGHLSQRVEAMVLGNDPPPALEFQKLVVYSYHDCDLEKCPVADKKLSSKPDAHFPGPV